ncbi:MAG: hypothetical protein P8O16_02040 [Algoriphagus sp.]|jgi:hypothetical protein|uniref:hypothetical protein n=1 Tax=Algoriphagus sp. TaxID=1872435 RepID=UPI002627C29A|nr:hypothetical protein [Algoriphagus sp.]MDG1276031.1 hypothetical protein [Algoriphagus sp.]
MNGKSKIGFAAKVMLAAGFGVLLGVSPLTSFGDGVPETGMMDVNYCHHNVGGDNGLTNFCQVDHCAILTGQGSSVGPCGTSPGMGG